MKKRINQFLKNKKPIICIQGLGFVGIAMLIAVASRKIKQENIFNVIGIDLENQFGKEKVKKSNSDVLPIETSDKKMKKCFENIVKSKNFFATTNNKFIKHADIIISDINLDINHNQNNYSVEFSNFKTAMKTIGKFMKKNALVITETTLPPGTSEKIAIPILMRERKKRKLYENLNYVYSYERVMPGDNYLDSIINMWRVYAGNTKEAANSFKLFFKKIINTRKYPMTELPNLISCETSKIIENSYRAANIAFIDEWSRFSENVGVDIYEVIEAIKKRPTHANIMYPGLGVGGYCLTKDPLFGAIASKQIHKLPNIQFPISKKSIDINNNMPKATVDMLEKNLKILKNKIVLILGLSYRPDTDDIRYSPSTILASKLISKGAKVYGYDPLVQSWGVFEEYIICFYNST